VTLIDLDEGSQLIGLQRIVECEVNPATPESTDDDNSDKTDKTDKTDESEPPPV
jgi:hypothetical protein